LRFANCENSLASAVEFLELVTTPRLALGGMVTEISDSSLRVVALFDGSFVSLVDVIMEGVLKGDGVVLLGTLNSNNK